MLIEILGDNLTKFFSKIEVSGSSVVKMTYKGPRYEVWTLSENVFKIICDMTESEFVELAGDDGWWGQSDGSVLGPKTGTRTVNNHRLQCWVDTRLSSRLRYESVSEYLCDSVGASTPRNVCACLVDLAKFNNMTISKLLSIYEPGVIHYEEVTEIENAT